jgi:hypothetical protein
VESGYTQRSLSQAQWAALRMRCKCPSAGGRQQGNNVITAKLSSLENCKCIQARLHKKTRSRVRRAHENPSPFSPLHPADRTESADFPALELMKLRVNYYF